MIAAKGKAMAQVQREHRKRVRIRAEMRVDSRRCDVVICNLSSRGLMLSADEAPARGTYIEISRDGVVTAGRVVWSHRGRFGVRTAEKLNVEAMAHRPSETRCMKLDGGTTAATGPAVRTFGQKIAVDTHHQAERNSWIAARMQFIAIGGSVAAVAVVGALIAYGLMMHVNRAVIAGLG